jgi:hypothetical protein
LTPIIEDLNEMCLTSSKKKARDDFDLGPAVAHELEADLVDTKLE